MTQIRIVREVPYGVEEAWDRVTDWERHSSGVPLTTITRTRDGFVARTAVGPLGFDDPMDVVDWDPPHRCRLVKRGRIVTGEAEILCAPRPDGGCTVTWVEDLHVRGVPAFAAPVEAAAARRLFGSLLDRLLH